MYSENKGKVVLDCLVTLDYRKLNSCADIICEEKKRELLFGLNCRLGHPESEICLLRNHISDAK